MRRSIIWILSCGIAVAMATMPAGPASATHDPSAELEPCTGEGYEGTFVCGLVIVNLAPGVEDIAPILDACPPTPEFVPEPVISDSPETEGQSVYALHVPTGSEIALRDCYLNQEGVANAVLGGMGDLTPNTAVAPPSWPLGEIGLLFLLLASAIGIHTLLAVHRGDEHR
jgi:hypothetical protein